MNDDLLVGQLAAVERESRQPIDDGLCRSVGNPDVVVRCVVGIDGDPADAMLAGGVHGKVIHLRGDIVHERPHLTIFPHNQDQSARREVESDQVGHQRVARDLGILKPRRQDGRKGQGAGNGEPDEPRQCDVLLHSLAHSFLALFVVDGHSLTPYTAILRVCQSGPPQASRACRPASLGGTSPVVLEALPVPPDYGRGLDDDEAFSPSIPGPSQPEPEDAVLGFQPWAFGPSVEDDELLAQSQVFRNQVSPFDGYGPNNGPDEPQKEHQHLLSLYMGVGCRSILGVLACENPRGMRFLVGSASSEGWHVQWE